MPSPLSNLPPGAYTHTTIVNVAEEHFPITFNALPDAADVPWEQPDDHRVGFCSQSLFLGYVKDDGILYKASAYLNNSGDVGFFRHSMPISRRECEGLELVGFWAKLGEMGERPELRNLKALVGYYFVAAGYFDTVKARKGWFGDLEVACKMVAGGGGAEDGGKAVGEGEDIGEVEGESGVESDGTSVEEHGEVDVEEVGRILQRLLITVRVHQDTWGQQVEEELKAAWPGYKQHWR